jgi:D-hydroxyproline dehydrogenase subunit alpha
LISSIHGDQQVERVTVRRVDLSWRALPGTEKTFDVDAVCLGFGLLPSTELARLAGCELRWVDRSAAWLPVLDDEFSSTIHGLAVAGDGAGVAGAIAAAEQGRIAAVAAARDLGHLLPGEAERHQRKSRRKLRRLERFRVAVDALYAPRPGLFELATADTVVCRCEDVTAGSIGEEIASGIQDIETLKFWTRVTMGPCQGRMCLPSIVARLSSHRGCSPEWVRLPRPRTPAKPLPLNCLNESMDGN